MGLTCLQQASLALATWWYIRVSSISNRSGAQCISLFKPLLACLLIDKFRVNIVRNYPKVCMENAWIIRNQYCKNLSPSPCMRPQYVLEPLLSFPFSLPLLWSKPLFYHLVFLTFLIHNLLTLYTFLPKISQRDLLFLVIHFLAWTRPFKIWPQFMILRVPWCSLFSSYTQLLTPPTSPFLPLCLYTFYSVFHLWMHTNPSKLVQMFSLKLSDCPPWTEAALAWDGHSCLCALRALCACNHYSIYLVIF